MISLATLVAVPIDIVVAEEDARLVTVEKLVEPSDNLSSGPISEVLLEQKVVGTVTQDMVACSHSDLV